MFNFLPGAQTFAIAGLLAAAGPIVIHLLNRRRFRVVEWAAMDFLLEALERNRKLLRLRDLLLLALRTAAVALFGLALARPYFSSAAGAVNPNAPLHAILILDNSLSMGHEKLGGATLLDEAKARAREFVEQLPPGSRVSVLPLCGSAASFSLDAYRTREDTLEAIDKLRVVDRTGSAALAADLARQASRQVPDLPDKRIVFLGDQQAINWPTQATDEALKNIAEMQVVSIAPEEPANTWIDSFRLEGGVADVETPVLFTAVVRHEAAQPRAGVQVTLTVDGLEVAAETVDLEPGQQREVTFPYRFDVPARSNEPTFVAAQVSIPADRLPRDDSRYLAVPVVAALPVVFVDQYGAEDESPSRNRYGETRHLRRLLAPVTSRTDTTRQLIEVRHVKLGQLDRQLLEDVRMVVVAGVESPAGATSLLREFVEQGGQLVLAAGADFDVTAWNQAGWQAGGGILPAPLTGTIGKLPDEPGELRPFFLDYESMKHDEDFRLAGVADEELHDLYTTPLFFKAVESDLSPAAMQAFSTAEAKRLQTHREQLATLTSQLMKWSELEARGRLTDAQSRQRTSAQAERETLEPHWLTWAEPVTTPDANLAVDDLVARNRPRVLAAFDNGVPYLVSRRLGSGQVLWISSGLFSNWNNLPKTNAILLMDCLLRGMLERTLPRRTLDSNEQLILPMSDADRTASIRLTRPDGQSESLGIDALGGDRYGVAVRNVTERGIYTIEANAAETADRTGSKLKLWSVPVAVNGPSRESEPAVLDAITFARRTQALHNVQWIGRGERIGLEGARVSGQDLWQWLLLAVLVCLLAELTVLGLPHRNQSNLANQTTE